MTNTTSVMYNKTYSFGGDFGNSVFGDGEAATITVSVLVIQSSSRTVKQSGSQTVIQSDSEDCRR